MEKSEGLYALADKAEKLASRYSGELAQYLSSTRPFDVVANIYSDRVAHFEQKSKKFRKSADRMRTLENITDISSLKLPAFA